MPLTFPIWGMLEKIAPTLLAGVPCIVKPATEGAELTHAVVKAIHESGFLPEGSLQLICGQIYDLFDHLNPQRYGLPLQVQHQQDKNSILIRTSMPTLFHSPWRQIQSTARF